MENFQVVLQVYLKSTLLQVFPEVAGKFPKTIGAAYENSNTFYKIFHASVETSKWLFFYFNEKLL